MNDYRNRPPVDAPRPTPLSVLRAAGWRQCLGLAGIAVAGWCFGYLVAVAGGIDRKSVV